MSEDAEFDETDEMTEVLEESDLVLGFVWHDEEQHWDLESYSFPETFTEVEVEKLADLAREFAEGLNRAGLVLPPIEEE